MKEKHFILFVILVSLLGLVGCECAHKWNDATCNHPRTCALCGESTDGPINHQWKEATCTTPLICSLCGETKGESLGHSWKEATCTEAATCYTCGQTSGIPRGHNVTNWTITTDSTCDIPGEENGPCLLCNQVVTQKLALKEHTPGGWTISVAATTNTKGIRTQACQTCGKELEKEEFSMTAEEIEAEYKRQCTKISYNKLARTPDQYKGSRIKFTGRVVQVCSEAESKLYYSTYRVATSGRYDNVVYICVDNYGSGSRILEGDKITFYGEYDGLYTYKTVLGSSLTIPKIIVEYID